MEVGVEEHEADLLIGSLISQSVFSLNCGSRTAQSVLNTRAEADELEELPDEVQGSIT